MNVKQKTILLILGAVCIMSIGCSVSRGSNPVSTYTPESPYQNIDSIPEGEILHVPTGIGISQEALFNYLGRSRVVYVGEVHSNMQHHRVQLKILRGLHERFPGQISVGMEMFQNPAQPKLDAWIQGELSEKDFTKEWYANWTQGIGYYKELLEYIRDQKIPLVALNASDALMAEVAQKGFKGLSEEGKKALPEIDKEDRFHRKALEAVFGGHSHGKEGFERFHRTMLLWDETMAQSIYQYLSSSKGLDQKMVVFSGGFHVAHGFGIPKRVFRRLPEPYVIVLPHTPIQRLPKEREGLLMDVSPPQLPLYVADFVWSVGYEELKEDRVYLGVRIEKSEEGIFITEVYPDMPAARAGIQKGDIVLSLDGRPMEEPFDLSYEVSLYKSGDRVRVGILREGKQLDVEATFLSSESK